MTAQLSFDIPAVPSVRQLERAAEQHADAAEHSAFYALRVSKNAALTLAVADSARHAEAANVAARAAYLAHRDARTERTAAASARAAAAAASADESAETAAAYACDSCRDTVARQLEERATAQGRRYPYRGNLQIATREEFRATPHLRRTHQHPAPGPI